MARGYRSATEYSFDEEHTDAIVRTAAYHRKDFGLSMIWFSSTDLKSRTRLPRSATTGAPP
ncbi:hypothetical protein FNYG_04612 [Fusarium nygamai]|uniref:Uncharacterized protein n=1 Tax=Gibberella nygamai TaxID=42673 RepID=A0A2K0WIF6_GIBNY|nr:hypothetical protein FNYG_04612 [Fusarium nygamai]